MRRRPRIRRRTVACPARLPVPAGPAPGPAGPGALVKGHVAAARRALLLLALVFVARGQAAAAVGSPADPEYRAALDLVYDGAFGAAEMRLAALAGAHPRDPVAPYLQALALEWRLEQAPQSHEHDAEVLAFAERALGLAEARLAEDRQDGRALLVRGAAHGVKSRLHLFRWDRSPASREAVRMREALLAARSSGVTALDLDFGLGLYDYYADTLPRFFKLVAFVLGIPAGDRDRGRAAIARVARGGSLFHDTEARVQMYDIASFFEQRPDRALFWIQELRRRYPGWPIWGMKLAELLREPLGLFSESAAVCREILDTAEHHRHVNYQPVVAEMAQVLLAEALLLDLRLDEARAHASSALSGAEAPDWVRGRAQLVVARSLELQGDAAGARAGYAAAASGADRASSRRAAAALRAPASAALVAATGFLARSRRTGEAGDEREAERLCLEAFRLDSASDEGQLCAARALLRERRTAEARTLARAVVDSGAPWLRPQARLVLAAALELAGERSEAISSYRAVWEQPYARPALRTAAAAALERLAPGMQREPPPFER
jgi:hypothetical protein